jgi:hypothetical protein
VPAACLPAPSPSSVSEQEWAEMVASLASMAEAAFVAGPDVPPEGSGAHRPPKGPRPPPAASQRPVPATPATQPSPGCGNDEASARVP